MTTLFGRKWYLRVGSVELTDLDIEFKVFKSIKREPNKCSLTVYGLSKQTRQTIETQLDTVTTTRTQDKGNELSVTTTSSTQRAGRPWIELRAGSGSDPSVLFYGQTIDKGIVTIADGIDVAFSLEAKDGGDSYQRSRMNQSFAAGTRVEDVLRAAVSAMAIGEGNLNDFARGLELTNGTTQFVDGYPAFGPAREVLNNIIEGSGLRWSIQNGILVIRERGKPLQNQATLITPDTGLIGSPTVDAKGILTAKCLIQPGVEPGRMITIQSNQFNGDYQVRSVEYSGSTFADEWFATITAADFANGTSASRTDPKVNLLNS